MLVIVMAGCHDNFVSDPGWDVRDAKRWAKSMGEDEPKVICNHGDYLATSWCNVTVKNTIYDVTCHYDSGCMK